MVPTMTIDDALLKDLAGLRDPIGFVSVYVGYTPEQAADPQPTTPIEIRNQVRDLRERLNGHEHADAVNKRLDELSSTGFDGVLDPRSHGRGRALFVAVSDGRSAQVSLQIPFRDRVLFADLPYLRPLVAAYDEGRPAGIVVVHAKGARLLEWRVGEVTELETRDFELTDAQLADIKSGPSPSNPQMHGSGHVARDKFDDRIDENRHRFMKSVVDDVVAAQQDKGWDRIVVAGAPKIRDDVKGMIPAENGRRVLVAESTWEERAPHEIAADAWPLLRSVHMEREVELVEHAKDRALSGGAGALGLRNVLKAINQGQVEHLLFQSDVEVDGYRTDEGTLHAEVGGPAAQAGFEMHAEPLLVERMIEKVMEMGGSVTPVDDTAAAMLGEHGGFGALLRW
jgi:hypothetical protein